MPPRSPQNRHALLAPATAHTFEWLDVGCTLWEPGGWRAIHDRASSQDLLLFELEHGVEAERLTYNRKCLAEAHRKKTTVTAEFAGFTDLFVPICSAKHTEGVLVIGPFLTVRSTSADIYERWKKLTGSRGHPSDPEFAHYISTTLSTLVLEGKQAAAFRRRAELCAKLMAGEGASDALYREHIALRSVLLGARMAERMWDAAQAMVDERTSRSWASQNRAWQRRMLGVSGFPEQVVVGLFVNQDQSSDPVDELVRRDAFQRACAQRAHEVGNVVSGRVGGHGVTLLVVGRGSFARTRRYLLELADEISVLGRRRFGFKLHLGACARPAPLTEQYRVALAAAEAALSKGVRLVQGGDDVAPATPLVRSERSLRSSSRKPRAVAGALRSHLDAVAVRSGYRLDSARAHLEATFELITESFAASGALDAKSLRGFSRTWIVRSRRWRFERAVRGVPQGGRRHRRGRPRAPGRTSRSQPAAGRGIHADAPERSPEARTCRARRRLCAEFSLRRFAKRGRHFRALLDQAARGTSPAAALAYGARQAPRPRSRGEAIRILERQLSLPHLQAKRGRDADGLSRTRSQRARHRAPRDQAAVVEVRARN